MASNSLLTSFIINLLTTCDFLNQDRCLDNGGFWDEKNRLCVHSQREKDVEFRKCLDELGQWDHVNDRCIAQRLTLNGLVGFKGLLMSVQKKIVELYGN